MRKATASITLLLASLPFAAGRQRRQTGQIDDPSAPDSAHFIVDVIRVYESVGDLYSDSDLVIQGGVKSVLPTQDLASPSRPAHNLITAAVIDVNRTFKGAAASEISVVQTGGSQGNRRRIPDQYRLMRQGEQYVLFLKRDPRFQTATVSTIPMYAVTGAWAGLFQIVNDVLQLSPAAHADLHARYEGRYLDVLLADLRTSATH
jgi:hypothetical protein